ncbi:MAG: EscR/YscR/HrcR family type III secretion system export apparatus protein [unclassified Hahellaceae]|nr:EscR/YscR/HrcR family type III secretion system export apparatus protein [Hahellaceae bacterium]
MELESLSPGSILITVIAVALAPFVAVMVTSFTKLVVVLSLLRNAMGLQQVPPNVVINGLAIILSVYVMYPVVSEVQLVVEEEIRQKPDEKLSLDRVLELAELGKAPLKAFLSRHASQEEQAFFLKTSKRLMSEEKADAIQADDLLVLIPAFTVSELTAAFEIGFLLFLPFLVVDLIVSNILLALGMMMLAPTMVSLPFKLLLFVAVGGWTQLIHGLILTYV